VIIDEKEKQILLIERKNDPYKNMWALPGGFIEEDETVETGAAREVEEETGLKDVQLQLVGVFSEPDRDPRGRIITVAFLALIQKSRARPVAGDDAGKVQWFSISDLPELAFDHAEIINKAINKRIAR
jgi:8-oxo-dGTP diphosphatase